MIQSFKDLIVWQKSSDFAVFVYKATKEFPKEEAYGLTSQIRRATISVSSNIAEGFKRSSRKEKVQFYHISLGSLAEAESQLEIALRLGYIKPVEHTEAMSFISEIGKMLHRLLQSANNHL
jgi:four helix bundle protein